MTTSRPDGGTRSATYAGRYFAINTDASKLTSANLPWRQRSLAYQHTLLRACANIMSFTPGTNMLAWLCTILKNHFLSQCRRRCGRSEDINDHTDSVASKPMQIAHTECNELWEALAKLEPRQREVLIMVGASGLSYDEAAKICGCPTGTIKSRVNRARAQLAQLLSNESPQDFEEDRIVAAVIASGDRAVMRV